MSACGQGTIAILPGVTHYLGTETAMVR